MNDEAAKAMVAANLANAHLFGTLVRMLLQKGVLTVEEAEKVFDYAEATYAAPTAKGVTPEDNARVVTYIGLIKRSMPWDGLHHWQASGRQFPLL